VDKLQETLTSMLVKITKIEASTDENTRDLKYHIKRTDLLETQVKRLTYLLIAGAAANAPSVIPGILKVFGL